MAGTAVGAAVGTSAGIAVAAGKGWTLAGPSVGAIAETVGGVAGTVGSRSTVRRSPLASVETGPPPIREGRNWAHGAGLSPKTCDGGRGRPAVRSSRLGRGRASETTSFWGRTKNATVETNRVITTTPNTETHICSLEFAFTRRRLKDSLTGYPTTRKTRAIAPYRRRNIPY